MLRFSIYKQVKVIIMCFISFYVGYFLNFNSQKLGCSYSEQSMKSELHAPLKPDINSAAVSYVVLILSGPSYSKRRDGIRKSWLPLLNNIIIENNVLLYKWNITEKTKHIRRDLDFVKIFFVIGSLDLLEEDKLRLLKEQREHNDLLILNNFKDEYQHLSNKMLESLRWVRNNVENMRYLIKCDDDSFVRIDSIINELETYKPDMSYSPLSLSDKNRHQEPAKRFRGLYWGYFIGKARVQTRGKFLENEWFLCDSYLPYAVGGGYVLSSNVVKYIADNADAFKRYRSEDVSLGVWTAALGRINRLHDVRFDTEWRSRGCRNDMLVRHKQAPADMQLMYATLVASKGEVLCQRETTEVRAYLYDWGVLPGQCCTRNG